MLVKVLQVGVDATDREINEALYGNAPPGGEHLVIGHESFGQVVEVGDKVTEVKPGDYVSCTVRRPGGSLFDLIGRNDITSEEVYYERGINLCHGYLTEYVRRRRGVHREGAAEPQAPGRPGRAGERLRQGDRAGVPGPAAAAGLEPQAGVRHGGRPDRPARHDDAQAPRHGGLHAGHQAGPASQVGDRRGLWRDLREHQADLAGRPGRSRSASPT